MGAKTIHYLLSHPSNVEMICLVDIGSLGSKSCSINSDMRPEASFLVGRLKKIHEMTCFNRRFATAEGANSKYALTRGLG